MTPELEEQLIEHLKDAHAIESRIQRLLERMIATSNEAKGRQRLQRHQLETWHRGQRLTERLQAHGESVGIAKKSDRAMPDSAGRRNARSGFLLARLKIAAYELLEAIAARAGDHETAQVARLNRSEEEALTVVIASEDIGLIGNPANRSEDAGA